MKLIVVESPAKARTIEKFLGAGYKVAASYGHIRDLPEKAGQIPKRFADKPWKRLAVDVDGDFEPIYVVSADARTRVAELKKLLSKADELLLATDEDREGEAISWHLLEVLKPTIPVRRITFHEITKTAIARALENPRDIDEKLVRAQESRRILDRLFGYELSPVLWKKVRAGLSAGRVQSVAVRLIVEREEERRRFVVATYYDVEALLYGADGTNFTARLFEVDGQRLASGKDFDPDTGKLKQPDRRLLLDGPVAERIQVCARSTESLPWQVTAVERKESRQRPAPPFTTSTLQQVASNRLKLSPSRTMQVAQRLYEGVQLGGGERVGLITYMRTDSLTLSGQAMGDAAAFIQKEFGADYTDGPRFYKTKSKGAQEAHEAIRPTSIARHPDRLTGDLEARELALYRLIWNRTVASQMTDARLDKTTATLECSCDSRHLAWRANGSIVTFPGFLRVDGKREQDSLLPDLREGQQIPEPGADDQDEPISQGVAEVRALRHETSPPARFTEASLVKQLEDEGIGRPSTYASIITTIQNRGYVQKKNSALVPTYVGMAVTLLLRDHFPRYVDVKFTAGMEEKLDSIARGDIDPREFLRRFYRGGADDPGLAERIAEELERIEFPAIPLGDDPDSGQPIRVKIGKKSVYVQRGAEGGESVTLPDDLLIDELTPEKASELLEEKRKSLEPIGTDPESGKNIYALIGPYGPYLQLGENDEDPKPKRVGLGRGTDLAKVDLELALKLLSLPRDIGTCPETGKMVRAGLGRFGPYVVRDKTFASVESADLLFSITLEDALLRIADKESGKKPVLAEIGPHPESGDMLEVLKGRYGPYVTHDKVHASLPRGREPETVTVDEALEWLEASATRKKTGKTTTKKVTRNKAAKKVAKKASKKTTKEST